MFFIEKILDTEILSELRSAQKESNLKPHLSPPRFLNIKAREFSSHLHREWRVTEALVRSNGAHVWSGFLVSLLSRLALAQIPVASTLRLTLTTILLATDYLYSFDLINQIMGVTEDALNKPYRPIPSGLISIRGASQRLVLAWMIYPILSYCFSGVEAMNWALFWQAWTYFNYCWPAPNSAILKSVFTGVASFVMIGIVNAVITAEHPTLDSGLLLPACLATWITSVVHISDFHDMEGDSKVGRRTLPLILGESRMFQLRQATCAIFCISHSAWFVWGLRLTAYSEHRLVLAVVGSLQWTFGIILGFSVVKAKSVSEDKRNYYYGLGALEALMVVYMALLVQAQ